MNSTDISCQAGVTGKVIWQAIILSQKGLQRLLKVKRTNDLLKTHRPIKYLNAVRPDLKWVR